MWAGKVALVAHARLAPAPPPSAESPGWSDFRDRAAAFGQPTSAATNTAEPASRWTSQRGISASRRPRLPSRGLQTRHGRIRPYLGEALVRIASRRHDLDGLARGQGERPFGGMQELGDQAGVGPYDTLVPDH